MEAAELGSLQHKVIRLYLERFDMLDEEAYHDLVQEIWDQFLQDKEMAPIDLNYRNYFLEIKNYSWRGIKTLLNIKRSYPDAKFSFEVEFFSDVHRGSIDCIISLENGLMGIVDFKRSAASVPTKEDVFDFAKIQLWYYMHNLKSQGFRVSFLGYLCLAELDKSQFVFDKDNVSRDCFGNIFPEGRTYAYSFDEKASEFERFLAEKIENILEDKNFLPSPRKIAVCKFCWIDKVCMKEESNR